MQKFTQGPSPFRAVPEIVAPNSFNCAQDLRPILDHYLVLLDRVQAIVEPKVQLFCLQSYSFGHIGLMARHS
jgi:hypothetical protein